MAERIQADLERLLTQQQKHLRPPAGFVGISEVVEPKIDPLPIEAPRDSGKSIAYVREYLAHRRQLVAQAQRDASSVEMSLRTQISSLLRQATLLKLTAMEQQQRIHKAADPTLLQLQHEHKL